MEEKKQRVERPSWNSMFFLEALHWSMRSHDPQTQCGCVFVRHHTILSTGYNGFIRSIDDEALPNLRPDKYDYMIHSEQNCILNCVRNGISTYEAIAYVTGKPCIQCLQYMYQAGISCIFYTNFNDPIMTQNTEEEEKFNKLVSLINEREGGYDTYGISIVKFVDKSKIYTKHLNKMLSKL